MRIQFGNTRHIGVKAPGGTKLMPHKHPKDRIYTVMSGVFYIGLGEKFDSDKPRRTRPAASSSFPAIPRTSTLPNPENTSRREQTGDKDEKSVW